MAKKGSPHFSTLENWADLELFLKVARAGSFSAAARAVGIEQSTVSRRIQQLERGLGLALFERQATRSVLTPIGESLVKRAEAIEANVHAFVDEAQGSEREVCGTVRVALTESIAVYSVIPEVLPALRKCYPNLKIELLTSYLVAQLGQREAEIALRFFRPVSGDLVVQKVATMKTAVIAHKSFRRAKKEDVPFISVHLEGMVTAEESYLQTFIQRDPQLITSSYHSQIEAVRAGLGAALIPRSLKRIDRSLVELNFNLPPTPELSLWLAAPRSLRHVPRIDAVWTTLLTQLKSLDDA